MNVTYPGKPDMRAVAKMINLEIIHHYYRFGMLWNRSDISRYMENQKRLKGKTKSHSWQIIYWVLMTFSGLGQSKEFIIGGHYIIPKQQSPSRIEEIIFYKLRTRQNLWLVARGSVVDPDGTLGRTIGAGLLKPFVS